jgi:hypothetical protein
MERASQSGQLQKVRVSDRESVLEMFCRGGVEAFIGFEFYFRDPREYASKKVRIERVNSDRQTLSVMDIAAKTLLEKCIIPGELTVGLATRSENDPVIRLLKQLKIDSRPFPDPALRVKQGQREEGLRTPIPRAEKFGQLIRSAPPMFPRPFRPEFEGGFRAATPILGMHGVQQVRGEHVARGGRAFRPFQPMFQGIKPV